MKFFYEKKIVFLSSLIFSFNIFSADLALKIVSGEDGGKIHCHLYDEKNHKSFPTKPKNAKKSTVATSFDKSEKSDVVKKGKEMLCLFKDLAPGYYAISGFHDQDGDRRLDMFLFFLQ